MRYYIFALTGGGTIRTAGPAALHFNRRINVSRGIDCHHNGLDFSNLLFNFDHQRRRRENASAAVRNHEQRIYSMRLWISSRSSSADAMITGPAIGIWPSQSDSLATAIPSWITINDFPSPPFPDKRVTCAIGILLSASHNLPGFPFRRRPRR